MKGKILLGQSGDKELYLPLAALKKHLISIGSTGSGKTVLSKVIIEEAALNNIPSIIIDPHGDLASLAIHADKSVIKDNNLSPESAEKLAKFPVRIFTPESKSGIPLSVSPLEIKEWSSREEKVAIVDQVASAMTQLLGYELTSDKGASTKGILYTILMERQFSKFSELISYLEEWKTQKKVESLLANENQIREIIRKLALLSLGKTALLFESGYKLNLDDILHKPAINVIYLNTLSNQEEKEFFISILVKDLYEWMLHHPSKNLQLLFLIDEIAPFIPAGARKPASKEILKMLFKQARKYGVGCLVATQNPGDIDYMAFSQFGSWAVGRLTTRQDQKKVEEALESISSDDISAILPQLLPGNFVLFSPDNFESLVRLKARWLYSEHSTLTEGDIARLMATKRQEFASPAEPKREEAVHEQVRPQKRKEQAGREILALRVADPEEIINQNLARSFLGKPAEHVLSARLELMPVYLLSVKRKTRAWLLLSRVESYQVLVNAVNGNLMDGALAEHDVRRLYTLDDDQLILYEILSRKYSAPIEDLAFSMRLPASKVRRVLSGLKENRIVSSRKVGDAVHWYVVKETAQKPIEMFHTGDVERDMFDRKANMSRVNVSEGEVESVMKYWFGVDITDSALLYLPYYRVALQGRQGERTIRINGYNGSVF